MRRDDLWTPMVSTGECRNHAHSHRSRLPVTTTAYRTTGSLITKPWPRARAASSLRTDRRHNSAAGPVSLVAFTKHIVRTRPCYDGAVPAEDEGRGARTSESPGLKVLRASRVPRGFVFRACIRSADNPRHGLTTGRDGAPRASAVTSTADTTLRKCDCADRRFPGVTT